MTPTAWLIITDFGNSAVVLPCAALVTVWLLIARQTRRLAAVWVGVVLGGGLIVAVTKVIYLGWGLGIASLDFVGISGHTTLAFILWPVLLSIAFGRRPLAQAIAAGVGFVFAAIVGYSRIMVHAHSPSEVISGAVLGIALSGGFLYRYRAPLRLPRGHLWLLVSLLLPLAIGHNQVAPSQHLLGTVAKTLSGHTHVYTRADLHRKTKPQRRP